MQEECQTNLLQNRFQQTAHFSRVACDFDAARFHHCQFLLCRTFTTGNDRTGVAHAFAFGCGNASDETDYWFFHVVFDPACAHFFCVAADFANHDDCVCIRILIEHAQDVDVLQAGNRIATDTDHSRLPETEFSQLTGCFISQGTRTRNDADAAFLVDVTRHDADLDFVWRNQAWAVWSEQQGFFAFHACFGTNHVAYWNTFGYANHQF